MPHRPGRGADLRDRARRSLRSADPRPRRAPVFVAEGIFAQEVVGLCRDAGVLAAAYCVRQHPMVTFWRRLTRDLREHRKPPLVLLRRGLALMGASAGSSPTRSSAVLTGDAGGGVRRHRPAGATGRRAMTDWPRQPDGRTCAPSAVVVAEHRLPAARGRGRGSATTSSRCTVGSPASGTATGGCSRPGRACSGRRPGRWPGSSTGGFTATGGPRCWPRFLLPVPVYLGSRWLPRHVVLVVDERDGEPLAYNPARGAVVLLSSSRWKRTWWAVLPR